MPSDDKPESGIPERIALTYLLAGAAWIFLSDLLADGANFHVFPPETQTLKGLAFVLATTFLVYALLRRSVRKLRVYQQKLSMTQFVTDNAGEAVLWIEASGRLRYANVAACTDLGHKPAQLLALTILDVDRDLTPESWQRNWTDLRDRGCVRLERTFTRRDGSTFPAEMTANYVQFGGDEVACVFARDISQRVEMERQIRASEERLRRAMEEAPLPVMLHADDGEILLLSRMWTERSGYGPEDIPTVGAWLELSGAGSWEGMRDKYRLSARFDEGTVSIRTKSGEIREWELQSSPLGELSDGRRMLLSMAIDSTDRSSLQKQFLQAQKMEAVGRLAAGIAHDFNNLLTLIVGYGQMLTRRPAPDKVEGYATEVVKAGERAAGLTAQLLAFTRQQQIVEPVLIDLRTEIHALETMLRRIIGEDVDLILDLVPDTGYVLLDPTQLGQMLMNLVVNARDAMPQGGALRIATRRAMLPDVREPEGVSDLAPGPYAVLHVTDTGTGIAPEVLNRMFEPFFTTKERGKGTGLGLATVKRIVEQAGGQLTVESTEGEGATFAIWLPVTSSVKPERRGDTAPSVDAPEHACIAVVEDEPGVRAFVTEALRGGPYSVVEAGSPREALALFSVYHGQISLLLTDVVMPGMNGFDLARKLKETRPGLRVLFTSGYTETAAGVTMPDDEFVFLRKPFSADDLLHSVAQVLQQTAVP